VGYLGKLTAGLALMAAAGTAVEYALYNLIRAFTCLSDLSFISDTACFTNAGTWAYTLPVGLAVGWIGMLVFAARGLPPDAPVSAYRVRAWIVAWAGGLCASGFTLIWAVAGPDAHYTNQAKTVGIVFGGLLFPLGLVPLLRELRAAAMSRAGGATAAAPVATTSVDTSPSLEPAWQPSPRPDPPPAAPAAPAGSSALERLNTLSRARDAGTISPEEFERQKAEILRAMTRGL
jgi:hypothetical protein